MELNEIIFLILLYGGGICIFFITCIYCYTKLKGNKNVLMEPSSTFSQQLALESPSIVNQIEFNKTRFEQERMEELLYKEEQLRLERIRMIPRYTVLNERHSDWFRYKKASNF